MKFAPKLLLVLVLVAFAARPLAAQTSPPLPERFTCNAINLSAIGSTTPTPLDITITRWTTPAEQERLISVLREKGQDRMAEALRDTKSIGSIRTPTSLAYDFRYAIQDRTKSGERRIILVTDRPLEIGELIDRSHSLEYPFSAIELLIDDSGRGKGNLWIAAKLTLLDNLLIVDNYADRPVNLTDVRRQRAR